MSKRWSDAELNILQVNLDYGAGLQAIKPLLPDRSFNAILRQAQNFDFGVKTEDGKKKFVRGKGSRVSKTDLNVNITTIVGKPRIATTIQEPTISLESKTHYSNDIVSNYTDNPAKAGLEAYTNAVHILQSNNLPVEHSFVCTFSTYILECTKYGDYNDK